MLRKLTWPWLLIIMCQVGCQTKRTHLSPPTFPQQLLFACILLKNLLSPCRWFPQKLRGSVHQQISTCRVFFLLYVLFVCMYISCVCSVLVCVVCVYVYQLCVQCACMCCLCVCISAVCAVCLYVTMITGCFTRKVFRRLCHLFSRIGSTNVIAFSASKVQKAITEVEVS